jgi:predicted aldo/keto reductase-like oxidoreductase
MVKNVLNRREFLSSGIFGIFTTGFRGIGRNSFLSSDKGSNKCIGKDVVLRKLGDTDIRLPVVNMGVMNAFSPELVKRSYEVGVRYFDTAAHYQRGNNEEMVGTAIQELNVRDQVIIGTKAYIPHEQRGISPSEKKAFFLKSADESLQRLKTDTIDIYYVHNVSDISYLHDPGICEAMQQLKTQGKVRYIGFSTHTKMKECIEDAIRHGFYDVILTAFNYAMSTDSGLIQTLEAAAKEGIGLIAMKTQCGQYWYREYVPDEKQHYYKGKILHTAVLKWVLHHDFITTAIPGYITFQQMEEDLSVAFDLAYSREERKFLEDRSVKESLAYCLQCYECVPTCPNRIDIPALMRAHLYAKCYGNFVQARETMAEIPKDQNIRICSSCDECLAHCTNRINIAGRIEELKAIWA